MHYHTYDHTQNLFQMAISMQIKAVSFDQSNPSIQYTIIIQLLLYYSNIHARVILFACKIKTSFHLITLFNFSFCFCSPEKQDTVIFNFMK